MIDVNLTYINQLEDSPLECTYAFPKDAKTLISNFKAEIDGKVINTKIMELETAEEKYEDAMASGKVAIMA